MRTIHLNLLLCWAESCSQCDYAYIVSFDVNTLWQKSYLTTNYTPRNRNFSTFGATSVLCSQRKQYASDFSMFYVSRYSIPLLLSRERWASWTENHMWYDISSFTQFNWWILWDSFNFRINVCSLVMLSCFAVVHRTPPRWSDHDRCHWRSDMIFMFTSHFCSHQQKWNCNGHLCVCGMKIWTKKHGLTWVGIWWAWIHVQAHLLTALHTWIWLPSCYANNVAAHMQAKREKKKARKGFSFHMFVVRQLGARCQLYCNI